MRSLIPGVKKLFPGYFSLVMATGIISIGFQKIAGYTAIAQVFFALNILAYFGLMLLFGLRLRYWWPEVRAQFEDPRIAPGFLTFVAATNVLANQAYVVAGSFWMAWVGAIYGLFSWVVLIYLFVFQMMVSHKKQIDLPITGAWLLMTVSTQSLVIICSNLAALSAFRSGIVLFALLLFLLGIIFYALILPKIALSLFFQPFEPKDLAPPHWINMGAAAISVLAGTNLIALHATDPLLSSLLPFVKGLVLGLWALGTWWWPNLIFLGLWKHLYHRIDLSYEPQLWSIVFPIGMYSVCTWVLGITFDIRGLSWLAWSTFMLALAAWFAVAVGCIGQCFRSFRKELARKC